MINLKTVIYLISIFLGTSVTAQREADTVFIKQLQSKLKEGQTGEDSLIAIKYFNDTLNLIPYPETSLLDSLIPDEKISYWELNFQGFGSYKNLYRSNIGENKLRDDSIVLTKAARGFGTVCPPGWCIWYLSAKFKSGGVITITDWKSLSDFIGKIDNQFDAYLWLTRFPYSESEGIPQKPSEFSRYKIRDDGYLIVLNVRVSDCPVTNAELLYFVRKDKNVSFIQILKLIASGGCI
jgi:hypothetical protein